MLDAKIMAAVLASLTAVSLGLDGGSVDASNVDSETIESEMNLPSSIEKFSDPLDKFRDMIKSRPEPENEVEMTFEVESLEEETFDLDGASVEMENFTSMKMEGRQLISDEKIGLHGFSGSLQMGEETSLKGSAEGLTSSGVNVSGITTVEETVKTEEIDVKGVERIGISLSNVKIVEASPETIPEFTNSSQSLNINSFSGEMNIRPSDGEIILNGKVGKLESGSFSFGG